MPNVTKVKCVDNAGYDYLTQGEVYEVVSTTWPAIGKHYTIVNDEGVRFPYPAGRFTIVVAYPNPPHPHADVIKAWADGAEIEYKYRGNAQWYDSGATPAFSIKTQYRIKPVIDTAAIAECERKLNSADTAITAAYSVRAELEQQLKQLKDGE